MRYNTHEVHKSELWAQWIFTYVYTHRAPIKIKIFPAPQKNPLLTFAVNILSLPKGYHHSDFYHHKLVLTIIKLLNRIIKYIHFMSNSFHSSSWQISINSSKFLHIAFFFLFFYSRGVFTLYNYTLIYPFNCWWIWVSCS